MRYKLAWPSAEGERWAPEAAASLIGQPFLFEGIEATIVEAQVVKDGMRVHVTIDTEASVPGLSGVEGDYSIE